MDNDFFIPASEMIMTAFSNIEKAELENNNKLLKTWGMTLKSIKSSGRNGENLGANLYSHSRIIDLKNGILLVEVDHPGWIQTLRLYQKYILTGLKRNVPELSISSLAYRLRGTKVELHSKISEDKIRNDIEERLLKEDEIIRKFDAGRENIIKADIKKEIPENLNEILDRLKNYILTEKK
ncbi:MAG: DUF721 domain-containing protein [Treponema sp.]|nr:DUF721 domain-containing protein [Treponema sp.]